jgi:hypothetical protein
MNSRPTPVTSTGAEVIMRFRTRDEAVASAGRLAAKYGKNLFLVTTDPVGGDWAPFVTAAPLGWYDEFATR